MDKPDGNSGAGMGIQDVLPWVTRVQVRDVSCQSACCSETPSSSEPTQAVPVQEPSPVQLRSKIGSMQQSAHHACPGGMFAEVEIPPPLSPSAELPELIFADAVSLEGEVSDGPEAAREELSEVVTASQFTKKWKDRLPSRRWWLDTTWNVACVGAMVALALTVRQWLFLGAKESGEEKAVAGSVIVVNDHEEPVVAPVPLEKIAGPVGRITDQLPINDSPAELDVMTGPLTDVGIEQVNFIENE